MNAWRDSWAITILSTVEYSECSVTCDNEAITKATAPLFRDQIEKAVHALYGTRRILRRRRRSRHRHTARLGCG
jgi:hypothetical protein